MTFRSVSRFVALAGTLFCASALAQPRFCIGGDLDHLTTAQRSACTAKAQAVGSAAAALHAPKDWHFVVVCGDGGWEQYADYAGGADAALRNASVDTRLEDGETFLRGERLDLHNLDVLQRVVAHEVARIFLHTNDEVAISRQIDLWSKQPHSQVS